MTDPFATCDCGQPADAGVFCTSCTGKLPKRVRQQIEAAIRKGDPIAYQTALRRARRILA